MNYQMTHCVAVLAPTDPPRTTSPVRGAWSIPWRRRGSEYLMLPRGCPKVSPRSAFAKFKIQNSNVVKSKFSNGHTVWLSWHLRIPLELLLHKERGASPGGVEEVNI